jgi:hypothetical protein
MMVVFHSLSSSSVICCSHVCWLSFLIQVDFLVLGVMSDFLLKSGYLVLCHEPESCLNFLFWLLCYDTFSRGRVGSCLVSPRWGWRQVLTWLPLTAIGGDSPLLLGLTWVSQLSTRPPLTQGWLVEVGELVSAPHVASTEIGIDLITAGW